MIDEKIFRSAHRAAKKNNNGTIDATVIDDDNNTFDSISPSLTTKAMPKTKNKGTTDATVIDDNTTTLLIALLVTSPSLTTKAIQMLILKIELSFAVSSFSHIAE